MATIRNPIEWGADKLKDATLHVESSGRAIRGAEAGGRVGAPAIRKITVADIREVLSKAIDDLAEYRTDVVFLCIIYPIVGLLLTRFAFDYDMLPRLFPLASGFALIGPVAAVGIYEMSRRRERGTKASGRLRHDRLSSFGAILVLGLLLLAIFFLWLGAELIYSSPSAKSPASLETFVRDVLTTEAGWTMIAVGVGVGFLFALAVLSISVVSFPLLLDRDVGVRTAIATSVRAVRANPGPMAVWGLIVAGGLVVGTLPLFVGLIVVMPVLGHATWHLYRKVVTV
jgi:uncharacterized membrane protein